MNQEEEQKMKRKVVMRRIKEGNMRLKYAIRRRELSRGNYVEKNNDEKIFEQEQERKLTKLDKSIEESRWSGEGDGEERSRRIERMNDWGEGMQEEIHQCM